MTAPKIRAKTLETIMDNPVMKVIQDRTQNVQQVVPTVLGHWTYDLDNRKPSPAYDDEGIFQGTDLDLSTFLFALAERNAVINIPTYKSRRVKKKTEGVRVTSKDNRHGQISGLVSNKDTFNFSIRIKDMNVIKGEEIGDYRTFMLTDFDGEFYEGWKRIEFTPSAKENSFLTENKLWSGNSIIFKDFIHPNRWISVYGQYYFILKALIQRLDADTKFLNAEVKRMQEAGIQFPEADGVQGPESYPKSEEIGSKTKIKVDSYEFIASIPEADGEYGELPTTQEWLVKAYQIAKKNRYTIKPKLNFIARSIESAFIDNGFNGPNGTDEKFPTWIKNCKWEDHKVKRTMYRRLVFGQQNVGEMGFGLMYRKKEKTETVNSESISSKDRVIG